MKSILAPLLALFTTLPALAQSLALDPPLSQPVAASDTVLGDLDGDLASDVVLATPTGVTVFFSDGEGGFQPEQTLVPIADARSVALADVDRDCNLDVISVHHASDEGFVLLGDGAGGFGAPLGFDPGNGPICVELADFTGDGVPDMIVLTDVATRVRTYFGAGDGTFTFDALFGAGSAPTSLLVGDLDGDGDVDAVFGRDAPSGGGELTNHGGGQFDRVFCSRGNTLALAFHDVLPLPLEYVYLGVDAARAGSASCAIGLGLPGVPGGQALASGDLDGDGRADLVVDGAVYVRRTSGYVLAATLPGFVDQVADVNRDGVDDLVVRAPGSVDVYLNRSQSFVQSPVNGHWYRLTNDGSWAAAEAQAVACGGHLATVTSVQQNDWLAATFGPNDFFIGLSDAANEGAFEWSSGVPLGYTHWAPGQPDDVGGADFVVFDVDTGWWRDEPATARFRGVIELISGDCDADGIPDAFEIAARWESDLDVDRVPDSCLPPTYCVSTSNSTGAPAAISGRGTADVWRNDLVLVTANAPPGEFGYYLTSQAQGFTPMLGGGPGNLCLATPIVRFSNDVLIASPGGVFEFAVDLMAAPPGAAFVPGETWNFQCWFRDGGPTNSNTSDGVTATFRVGSGPALGFAQAFRSAGEGDGNVALRLVLERPAPSDLLVAFEVGGSATPGVDYALGVTTPFTIPAGVPCFDLSVDIVQDSEIEPDETVVLSLVGAPGAHLVEPVQITLELSDDD